LATLRAARNLRHRRKAVGVLSRVLFMLVAGSGAFRAAPYSGGCMPSRHVARLLIGTVVVMVGIGATALAVKHRVVIGVQDDGRILVPNGQALTPAGTHIEVNDRPLGMVVSPNGALLAVVTGSNFNPRALHLIDVNTRTLKQTIAIANSFVGVAFTLAGDTIYVGGGASNDVKIFKAAPDGSFAANGTIPIRADPLPAD
jgi:DNA-binding beta-propeller fold protein YncE